MVFYDLEMYTILGNNAISFSMSGKKVWIILVIALIIFVGAAYWIYLKLYPTPMPTGYLLKNELPNQNNFQSQATTPMTSTTQTTVPPTDVTANWQTFTDNQYGFSLKYPPGWNIYASTSSSYIALSPSSTSVGVWFSVGFYPNPQKMTSAEFVSSTLQSAQSEGQPIYFNSELPVMVASSSAEELDGVSLFGTTDKSDQVYIAHDSDVLAIELGYTPDTSSSSVATLRQILETITFIQ